jgi:hypothetical protein
MPRQGYYAYRSISRPGIVIRESQQDQLRQVPLMAEAAITCATCGTQQTLRGTDWEVAAAIEVWQKEHERAMHEGEKFSAWKIEASYRRPRQNMPRSAH